MTSAGHVHIIPADLSGAMLEARAEVIFFPLHVRLESFTSTNVQILTQKALRTGVCAHRKFFFLIFFP
jgi:hypothetical protein